MPTASRKLLRELSAISVRPRWSRLPDFSGRWPIEIGMAERRASRSRLPSRAAMLGWCSYRLIPPSSSRDPGLARSGSEDARALSRTRQARFSPRAGSPARASGACTSIFYEIEPWSVRTRECSTSMPQGRVPVTPPPQVKSIPNVFVIGDLAAMKICPCSLGQRSRKANT